MSWYVEFEVEDEAAEERFFECLENIGLYAEKFTASGSWSDLFELEQAAFALAKEMGYNVQAT